VVVCKNGWRRRASSIKLPQSDVYSIFAWKRSVLLRRERQQTSSQHTQSDCWIIILMPSHYFEVSFGLSINQSCHGLSSLSLSPSAWFAFGAVSTLKGFYIVSSIFIIFLFIVSDEILGKDKLFNFFNFVLI